MTGHTHHRLDDCSLCRRLVGNETGVLLWQDASCQLVWADDEACAGFCRLIWKAHVAEMSDLSERERQHCLALLMQLEIWLRHSLAPDKINLASLGNRVSHLHWHVIPRWQSDAFFPDSVWSSPQRPPPASTTDWPRWVNEARAWFAAKLCPTA